MDNQVLAVQEWLNLRYQGKLLIERVPEDGNTGWTTIYALTNALQLELGSPLANAFGPATAAAYKSWGEMSVGNVPNVNEEKGKAIVQILKGAMYCKGYNPGGFNYFFNETTKQGVMKLQEDAGLPVVDGKVYDYIFKAFLTMDAYVLLSSRGGDPVTREIQRALNNRYYTTSGVQPTDGLYQRGTNKSLIYGLQTEMGIPASSQTGSVGPSTRTGLPTLREGSSGQFVTLFRYALYFNGFSTYPFSGTYTGSVKSKVIDFQKFTKLGADGIAGKQTWLSALVSTGDPERPGTACDTSTTITPAKAQTLKSLGYKTVGRYLVNVPGGRNKKIQPGELKTIFDAGLTIFPIYQTVGDGKEYFGEGQGRVDGAQAAYAANQYGFKAGTVIYFAVDFDALGEDIDERIVPYFQSVVSKLNQSSGGKYKAGVYGPRAVCIKVSERAGVGYSFVSGMSTGFSGNLGYPLPTNWAFDQIKEYTVGTGDGSIAIDKNIQSGLDQGQSTVELLPQDGMRDQFFSKLDDLYDLSFSVPPSSNPPHPITNDTANIRVLHYLRHQRYSGPEWIATAGKLDDFFTSTARETFDDVKNFPALIDPDTGIEIDLPHLAATCNAILVNPIAEIADFAGWGGDFLTVMKDAKLRIEEKPGVYSSIYEASYSAIGAYNGTLFTLTDLIADIDAYNIAMILKSDNSKSIVDVLKDYYILGQYKTRFTTFINSRYGTLEKAQTDTENLLYGSYLENIISVRRLFMVAFDVPGYTETEGKMLSQAWVNKLDYWMTLEGQAK